MNIAYNVAYPYTTYRMFVCKNCGKVVAGGEFIQGVFYCPMCASIIHANNSKNSKQYQNISNIPECCKACKNHPSNGGSGVCQCILGNKNFY